MSLSGTLVNVTLTAPDTAGEYFIGVIYSQDDTFNYADADVVFMYGGDMIVVEENEVQILIGDVNGDNRINTRDLSLMKRYVAGTATENELVFANSDINDDGKVNTRDISALKRLIAS